MLLNIFSIFKHELNIFICLAYNPKSTDYRRKKYKQKLTYFEQKCNLIDFLFKQATIKYKDPAKRSSEYNDKLESFFALQDNVPTMNWLA